MDNVSIVEHSELKLIGIPCISLTNMSNKYQNAKEGLLTVSKHFPNIINPSIHYGIWPQAASQENPETHAYILCVEVQSFDDIPDWFFKTTLPAQRCVVAVNANGDFDAAGRDLKEYIDRYGLNVSASDRAYTICERYNYAGEGFARYSLPIKR